MNHFDQLKHIFYQNIEKECFGTSKEKAYFHSLSVCHLCQKIAIERHLNIQIASIMGLFHDYSQFINHTSFHHAKISSEMTHQLLLETDMDEEDIVIIVNAIAKHSNKDCIDDDYSELLKDADVLAQYLAEPDIIFDKHSQERLKKYLPK